MPICLWMHRGCVPFLSPSQFEKFYWPTLKEIIERLWAHGCQTLFYAEGDWTANLKYIARTTRTEHYFPCRPHRHRPDLPARQGEVFHQRRDPQRRPRVGHARAGPRVLQAGDRHAWPGRRLYPRRQRDPTGRLERQNLRVMTEAGRELGVYGHGTGSQTVHNPMPSSVAMVTTRREAAAGYVCSLGRKGQGVASHLWGQGASSNASGRKSMRWRTLTFGRYLSRFEKPPLACRLLSPVGSAEEA